NALVVQNRQASSNSQRVFVGVAGGSIVLALLLGFILSWSLIGPIQRTESRLAEIAAGDFSKHLDVPNRDELGVLAANVNLINDILDLAKIEAGHMELELSDVSLADVLQSGLTMHGERATRGGITLGLSIASEEIMIQADERKVRQVVFNLLSNAIKFTPPEG